MLLRGLQAPCEAPIWLVLASLSLQSLTIIITAINYPRGSMCLCYYRPQPHHKGLATTAGPGHPPPTRGSH